MGKTGTRYLLETTTILEDHDKAKRKVGWYNGFEYRIKSDDPKFNSTGIYCYKCGECHYSPYEGKWRQSDRPLEIGTKWAKAHHIQSIIEARSIIFERKIGKKTLSSRTWANPDSFKPQSGWEPCLIISKSGNVTTIDNKIHTPIKIKNRKPIDMDVSIPEGFVIYTTKESDQSVHEILASLMNYTPQSLINPHPPSDITCYDYRRPLELKSPTAKISYWSVYNGRVNAGILIKRIREQFHDDGQVKIELADGVDLE